MPPKGDKGSFLNVPRSQTTVRAQGPDAPHWIRGHWDGASHTGGPGHRGPGPSLHPVLPSGHGWGVWVRPKRQGAWPTLPPSRSPGPRGGAAVAAPALRGTGCVSGREFGRGPQASGPRLMGTGCPHRAPYTGGLNNTSGG